MIAVDRTVLVLLAAGRSSRFGGTASKLDHDLSGRALGLHVAYALNALPFLSRVAIVDRAAIDYAVVGFRVLQNVNARDGMGSSVRLGVACASDNGADAVLIVLADMPRVTAGHVRRLFDATTDAATVVASSDGVDPRPPAIFGRDCFDLLLALDGDAGARDLLRGGRQVVASPAELIDVDTPDELETLRALVQPRSEVSRADMSSAMRPSGATTDLVGR